MEWVSCVVTTQRTKNPKLTLAFIMCINSVKIKVLYCYDQNWGNVPLHTCMGNFCREISQVWVMDTQLVWFQWVAELRIAVEGACDRDCNSKLCSSTEWRSISDLSSHLQDFTWLKFAIAVCMVLYVILSLVLEPFFRILPFKKIFLCMN